MRQCVILSARPLSVVLRSYVPPGAFVIAADAGWRNAEALGLQPDLVLGDFDSSTPPPNAANLLRLPSEKNDTDTHFAAREAVRRGFGRVTLLGATGGRPDHTFANYSTLLYLARQGVENLMADEESEIRCIGPGKPLRLNTKPGHYLSVFAFGGPAKGVVEKGVKYPLANVELEPGYPLGVSNEFVGAQAEISCTEGFLLVITTLKDGAYPL